MIYQMSRFGPIATCVVIIWANQISRSSFTSHYLHTQQDRYCHAWYLKVRVRSIKYFKIQIKFHFNLNTIFLLRLIKFNVNCVGNIRDFCLIFYHVPYTFDTYWTEGILIQVTKYDICKWLDIRVCTNIKNT